jgi:hypothetical protein
MSVAILQHVPSWVWVLLAALIALGISQSFPRRRTLRSATVLPVAMIVLSFYGVVSVFPGQPMALVAWAVGIAAAVMSSNMIGAWKDISWSEQDQCLIVPGSWAPLVLILGLFIVKFGVGAALATRPDFASDTLFAALAGLAYGSFSGVFFSRGLVMWKTARQTARLNTAYRA